MPTLNLPYPGSIIKDSIIAVGLTLTEAAAHLDVSEPWLAAVLAGQAAITAELAVRLELAGWSKAAFWLRLQTAYDLRQAQRREGDFKVRRFPEPPPEPQPKKPFPQFGSDEEAEAWLSTCDLSEYDFSGFQRVQFAFRQVAAEPPRTRAEINELAAAMHDGGTLDTATFQRITNSRNETKSKT